MSTAIEVIDRIHAHGIECAKQIADVIVITPEMIATEGAWFAQGDVNFTPIPAIPKRAIAANPVSQLAPGTSKG
jgi:hypothetical protein